MNNLKEVRIIIGEHVSTVRTAESVRNIREYAAPGNTVIVTDENLNRHYSSMFSGYPVIVIGTGEGIKTLATVETIVRKLIELRAHRKTFLLGIGGGDCLRYCRVCGFDIYEGDPVRICLHVAAVPG